MCSQQEIPDQTDWKNSTWLKRESSANECYHSCGECLDEIDFVLK